MRKLLIISTSAIAIVFAAFFILFLYSPVPQTSSFPLTLDQIRKTAVQIPGTLPSRINILSIAETAFPPGFAVAGSFETQPAPFYAYQIVYSGKDRHPVIIDAGVSRAHLTGISRNAAFHEKEYEQIQRAMLTASAIVFTHEHADHMGGFATSPFFKTIAPKALITSEQKESSMISYALFPEGALNSTKTLSYNDLYVLAPGIVLIKTPGHSAGHQAVYIRRADGREFILAGDIGWHMDNIRIPRGRPLITSLVLGENRDASASQLRWLNEMEKAGITVIVTHDKNRNEELIKKGMIGPAFELSTGRK